MGFAPSQTLHDLSFADVLDEATGHGYQRRFNSQHSLDFRRYIQKPSSTTIPLTFNLRPRDDGAWRVVERRGARPARLEIAPGSVKILSQVDCQHRLGHLADLPIELPFMCFLGLSQHEEMEIFNVINSKARGLSGSLLDFHDAQLSEDLAKDRPELFIAMVLRNDTRSPWFRELDLGGKATSGLTRRASLRTLQKAIQRFLARSQILEHSSVEKAAQVVIDFWSAVAVVLPHQWAKRRQHYLNKGIGVYALMELAADFYTETPNKMGCDKRYFCVTLGDFATEFDWSTDGPLKGLGGEGGVKTAIARIREARRKAGFRVVNG
jgi:DGQHR domain-containing protein